MPMSFSQCAYTHGQVGHLDMYVAKKKTGYTCTKIMIALGGNTKMVAESEHHGLNHCVKVNR